jgi:RsiW-degrading membrane proteinase PrsW (M82 family)
VTTRPNPARWLWYAYGGRLPDRYHDWVRRDTTSSTWMVRHLIRTVVEALPILVLAFVLLDLFTPVPAWAIVGVLLIGMLVVLFFTIGTARDLVLVRLARHGFPSDVVPPPSRLLPEDAGRKQS